MAYVIQTRIPNKTPWQSEPDARYATEAEAERAMARLEPSNDDGEALEYRIVELA